MILVLMTLAGVPIVAATRPAVRDTKLILYVHVFFYLDC
jgi:hypothetical protein